MVLHDQRHPSPAVLIIPLVVVCQLRKAPHIWKLQLLRRKIWRPLKALAATYAWLTSELNE
jgi:hypothetical protein